MTRSILAMVLCAVLLSGCGTATSTAQDVSASDQVFADAYTNQQSDVQVTGAGTVIRILADDNDGGRHQRFIVELASGQTLLIAHNIDLAPRLTPLQRGDSVAFNGVYEWNAKGGLVHWTHRDPSGQHRAGWLRLHGETFQ